MDKKQQKNFSIVGGIFGALGGVGLGPKTPVGMCASGITGGFIGYVGAYEGYYGYEWAVSKAGVWNTFKKKMAECGTQCDSSKNAPCLVKQLFEQIWNEQ